MAWSTSAPSLPSGSSWVQKKTVSYKQNWWGYTGYVYIARLANAGIAVKFELDNTDGSLGDAPPYAWYFKITIGTATATDHSQRWSNVKTYYWTGNLGSGVSLTASVAAWNNDGTMQGSWKDVTFSGPAYVTKFTIAYDANGGSGAPGSQTKTYGSAITLSSTVPSRTGYTFLYWKASNGTVYYPGSSYSTEAGTTMTAQWQIIKYAVTYNGNGADGGSTSSQEKTYGTALTLRSNGFTRTNYSFVNWNTKADGTGTTYAAGASYTTNAALTLYAIWKKNNIPVFINVNGTVRQVEKAYMNVNGTIKECTVYFRDGNTIYTLV